MNQGLGDLFWRGLRIVKGSDPFATDLFSIFFPGCAERLDRVLAPYTQLILYMTFVTELPLVFPEFSR